MSELVTSAAAATSQFNLFAPRQQVSSVERNGAPSDGSAATSETAQTGLHANTIATIATISPARSPDLAAVSIAAQQEGPSRARIDISSLGLNQQAPAAPQASTPDALPQFDNSGDSGASLQDPDKSGGPLHENTPSLSNAGGSAGEAEGSSAAPAPAADSVTFTAEAVPPASAATAGPGTDDTVPGQPKKLYADAAADGTTAEHKFVDTRQAAAGGTTATVNVPKKFYGQGTETVAGAAQSTPVTLHEKAARQPAVVLHDDGTGEKRFYDKVAAQAETQHRQSGHSQSNPTLHEKARQIAEAVNGGKRTVLVQLSTYNAAAASTTKQAAFLIDSTDVTA